MHRDGRAYHVTARAAAMRMDRHLGVLDPWTFEGRSRTAGFGLSDFRFLGEDFVHRPIEEQIRSGTAVPGYIRPGGSVGSPFGPAAEGIFYTRGTPDIANWNRTEFIGGDVVGEILLAQGHALRAGASARFYEVENYERVLAYLPGSSPSFARFYPVTANAWTEISILSVNNITAQLGVRVEGFRSGLRFQENRGNIFAPVIDSEFKTFVMPRLGVAIPFPFSDNRTVAFFNYGRVAQPPDFRFFLDSTLGDSLRVDIKRQGNPNLAFETGSAYEFGLRHLFTVPIAVNATVFFKELNNLVTSSLPFPNTPVNQFTTGDFGSVRGIELSVRGRWPFLLAQAGYSLQQATGVTSGAFESVDSTVAERRVEFPLAFDRRHSFDFAFLLGHAAGAAGWRLGVALTGSVQSGFPIDRLAAGGEFAGEPVARTRLPWSGRADIKLSYDLGSLGVCDHCRWRLLLDARNITDRKNIIALRRDTGGLAPSASDLSEAGSELRPLPLLRRAATSAAGNGVLVLSAERRSVRSRAAAHAWVRAGAWWRLPLGIAATVLALESCRDDVAPFEGEDRAPSLNPAVTRLTSSPGDDRTPSWSAGSDSVYYSAQNPSILPGQPGALMAVAREGGPAAPILTNVQSSGSEARWLVSPAVFAADDMIAYAEIGPLWEPGLPVCEIQQLGLACVGPVADTVPPLKQVWVRVRDLQATGPIDDDPALLVFLSGVSRGSISLPTTFVVHDYPFQQLFKDERVLVFAPSWSPDGQRIVFSDGLQLFIWTVGEEAAEAIPGTEDAMAPAWSPDGERIAFFRVERTGSINGACVRIAFGDVVCEMERTIYTLGRRVLALIRPDGTGLTDLGEGEDPAWSTDGATLLFRRDGQIWLSNPDGSDASPIPFSEDGREPALSPDGRHLAFSKLTSRGDYDIWVIALDSLP